MSYGEESFPFLGEISADNVNLRSGQSENFERLLQFQKGQEVVVLGRSYSWYKVRLPAEVTLYVSSEYVKPAGGNLGIAKADRLNIRAGKGVHFSVLGQLSEGDKVRIKERTKEWYGIEPVEKTFGWVLNQYVAFKSQFVPSPAGAIEEHIEIIEGPAPVPAPATPPESETLPAVTETPSESETPTVAVATVVPETPREETITVTGRLEPVGQKEAAPGFSYKLVTDDAKVYYLHAHKAVLDNFRHLKVKVHGKTKVDPANYFPHPVIVISKINLII
jgi:uncharacterized protein YraI